MTGGEVLMVLLCSDLGIFEHVGNSGADPDVRIVCSHVNEQDNQGLLYGPAIHCTLASAERIENRLAGANIIVSNK